MEFYFKLPSIASVKKFLVFLLFAGNIAFIFYFWFAHSGYYIRNPDGGNLFIALGRLSGLLGEFFLLTELVMIGRIHPLEHLFGFDRLNMIHRWIGYNILILLLAHPLFLTIGNAQANGVSYLFQFQDFLANTKYVLLAFIGLLLFLYVIFISIFARKKVRYETWYFTHLLTYAAVGLALAHQMGTGDLIGGVPLHYWYILNFSVFGLVLLYRFMRPLSRFAFHRFFIQSISQESPDAYSIYVSGHHMEYFKFESGQYANISILAKGMWQAHPFSFSSAYNGEHVRFTIKKSGDFTAKIPSIKPGTHVIIDGPLGLFVEKRAVRKKFLFIAGGIGITPLHAMIESLTRNRKDADIAMIYAVKTENDLVFRQEIENMKKIIPNLAVHYVLGTPVAGYESGRVDKDKIIRLVPDFYSRDVFLCGPPPMMQAVFRDLKEVGFSKHHVHFEKFSF